MVKNRTVAFDSFLSLSRNAPCGLHSGRLVLRFLYCNETENTVVWLDLGDLGLVPFAWEKRACSNSNARIFRLFGVGAILLYGAEGPRSYCC